MKVLLIAPPIMDVVGGRLRVVGVDALRECPPLGIYSLAAILEGQGHDAVVADLILHATRSLQSFESDLDGCDLVGIGATSMAWPAALDAIRQVRHRRPDVPIVCGGIHPTLFDRYVLTTFPVQFVVRGEGEIALSRLCDALGGRLAIGEVPNLSWIDSGGRLVRNEIDSKLGANVLESLPLADFARLPEGAYKCLAIESSRGCAYDCSFCSTPYRKTWRGLSPRAVVDRLEHALAHIDRTTSACVHIVDDEFSMNPKRATEIARLIRERGLSPNLLFDSRAPDLLHPGFVSSIAEYTAGLLVGAECGYDEGLERVGKGTTCASLEGAARVLADNGIAASTDFSFILGLPWETKREVEQTIQLRDAPLRRLRRPRHDAVVPPDPGIADLGGRAPRVRPPRVHVRRLWILSEPLSVPDVVPAQPEGDLRDLRPHRPAPMAGGAARAQSGRPSSITSPGPSPTTSRGPCSTSRTPVWPTCAPSLILRARDLSNSKELAHESGPEKGTVRQHSPDAQAGAAAVGLRCGFSRPVRARAAAGARRDGSEAGRGHARRARRQALLRVLGRAPQGRRRARRGAGPAASEWRAQRCGAGWCRGWLVQ